MSKHFSINPEKVLEIQHDLKFALGWRSTRKKLVDVSVKLLTRGPPWTGSNQIRCFHFRLKKVAHVYRSFGGSRRSHDEKPTVFLLFLSNRHLAGRPGDMKLGSGHRCAHFRIIARVLSLEGPWTHVARIGPPPHPGCLWTWEPRAGCNATQKIKRETRSGTLQDSTGAELGLHTFHCEPDRRESS